MCFLSFVGRLLFVSFFFFTAWQEFNGFGDDGGSKAKGLKPMFDLYVNYAATAFGISYPDLEIRHIVAAGIAFKGIGGILFLLGSSIGAYLLIGIPRHQYWSRKGKTAKIAGTIISLAGVTTMTFYKGSALRNYWGATIHIQGSNVHESWLKGSILVVASCITWSIWYIMQAVTLKRYPAQLSLTAWMCFVGGAQSAVFTVFIEHKSQAWRIGLNIDLWNVIYSGAIISGLIIYFQLWCTEEKGPVFVTMFNPLSTILVALLAYFVFGERMYVGSLLGGLAVIIGLYLLLWGKEKDRKTDEKSQQHSIASSRMEQEESQAKLNTDGGSHL